MGNTNRYEGGIGFGGDSREVQTQEYRTIPKSSLSQEQQATYVSAIQKLGGFNGTKWEAKITKYFNENDYVIDLQQEGLNQFDLKKIFNQYSDDQEDTIPEVGDESYKKYLNSRSAETSKRYDSGLEGDRLNVEPGPIPDNPSYVSEKDIKALEDYYKQHPDQFPSGKYLDVKEWENWRDISIKYNEDNNKWTVSYRGFFKGEEVTQEFDSEEKGQQELNKLKNYNKQIALDLIREARNFAIGEDLEAPWTDLVDVSAETVIEANEETMSEKNVHSPIDTPSTSKSDGVDMQGSAGIDQEAQPDVGTGDAIKPESVTTNGLESSSVDGGVDDLFENLPEVGALQSELDRLIDESVKKENNKVTETVGKLPRIEGREYTGEVDSEEIFSSMEVDILRENARQSILEYQKFIEINRNNLKDEKIYNQYRIIEKKAWSQVSKFTHQLGGEMATLSQERDIQLAHPEVVDIEKYLVDGGKIILDAEGHITHLNINGNIIELNRPRTIDELLRAPRPTHILYHSGTPISEDDPKKQNYKGLVIEGLNENTLAWIEGVLSDKQFLESVIVDETTQSNPELDGNQEEVAIVGNAGNVLDSETVTQFPEQAEGGETTPKVSLDDLRLAYAKAEEAWNRKRGDEELEDAFKSAREAYNTELEKVLKLQVAEGQADNIHQIFKAEVMSLRDNRIEQSQELQGKWEKRLNPIKEKFVNFVIKHKKIISRLNLAAGIAGGALALTGVGIPLAGGLAVARRMVSATLLGVSTGEGIRSLGEDADINSFWGKIKFQAVIPKLVQESLASSEDEFKQVSGDVLKERLGTLEAYYRLNGGKFNDNQQKAYEKVLTELARRVQENVIDVEQNQDELQSDWQEQKPQELTDDDIENLADENWEQKNILAKAMPLSRDREINKQYDLYYKEYEDWKKSNPERYASELLNTISDKRIVELDKFRKNRKTATIAGLGVGLLAGGAVHLSDEFNKPDSVELTDGSDYTSGDPTPEVGGAGAGSGGPGGASAPEAGTGSIKPLNTPSTPTPGEGGYPPAPDLPSPEEALRMRQAAAAANEAREVLAQDVSSLDSGETIWGEIAEQLGENASQGQIQQAVENYLQSELGQESIYKLAQGTEGGRELLAQWGIDNADAMASLSKDQLFEISRYLAPGELEGITELSVDNLDALSPAEYVESSPVVEPTVESASTEPPAASSLEAQVETSYSELPPVETTEFNRSLSEALGTSNLTETQLQEAIYSFATSEQGSAALYNQIISNEEGAGFLSGFGVNNAADFANLRPDELYEIAQTVGVENLDKLPGFELNEIILSKFEDAPDMVELVKGSKPLDMVNRYIASEVGNLPYDASLGQQILNTYLETPQGKQWLYDAIIINNPDKLNGNQNIQFVEEYFRQKGIKSGADINWLDLTQDRRFPTSIFWRETVLAGGRRIPPLSTLLQPSKMPGIKDAVRQVLTKQ